MTNMHFKLTTAQVESIRAAEFEKAVHKLGDGVNKKQLRAVEELSKVRGCAQFWCVDSCFYFLIFCLILSCFSVMGMTHSRLESDRGLRN